jgi:Glycosyltransferase family 87
MGAVRFCWLALLTDSHHVQRRTQSALLLLFALLAAASMWFYVDQILVPYQKVDARAHDRPRANLSDLYPRWLGARELLLHHRNPYGEDITKEIQRGYYGRELDPNRPNDPKDQQGFAYPVYVVFLLAPLIGLPFPVLHLVFYWLLALLTAASVVLWLQVLRWQLSSPAVAACIVFTLGSFPAVQGIKLQQLSLLVAVLLAASAACMANGLLILSGVLLALATIKPQLALPFVVWLFVWALSDWRMRRKFIFGFAATMLLLEAASEIVLPGWWRPFVAAIQQYHRYTQNQSVLDQLFPWAFSGKILAAAAMVVCAFLLWNSRREDATSAAFGRTIALVMALTTLVVPMYAPYNQLLLLPAVLALVRDRGFFVSRSPGARIGYLAGFIALAWQWIAALILTGACMFGPQAWALSHWGLPFLATFIVPILVFALMLLDIQRARSRLTS